jgi:hypothetical protein
MIVTFDPPWCGSYAASDGAKEHLKYVIRPPWRLSRQRLDWGVIAMPCPFSVQPGDEGEGERGQNRR